ncbi:MAG: DUF1501 domain-containing protein [Rhodobacterales bacterium]|nr:DUF1501 domain-containing protein [Rhodobacterales bacterium]
MGTKKLDRRAFLTRSGLIGCSLATSPLFAPITFASADDSVLGDNRLVVIILRGGMDGIDVVQPFGDPDFAGLRQIKGADPVGAEKGPIDLDGFFALHPALGDLMPLWRAGQLGFGHAVSTPYRDKRSHFDGQDLLEAGTVALAGASGRDGWLNRMLQEIPSIRAETAYSIGREDILLLRGQAEVANWSPNAQLNLSEQARRLTELMMAGDPLFADATAEALRLAEGGDDSMASGMGDMGGSGGMMMDMRQSMETARKNSGYRKIAEFAAEKLRDDTRVAAFSINGWDTHARQTRPLGKALKTLSETILQLQAGLGPIWGKTTVVAVTEFGRTARLNGTKGTDHGTGGAMILAGGALRGGRVVGRWPGLAEADLYQRRDLMPTRDVRANLAWIMRGLFGLPVGVLEKTVFPGLDMGTDPRLIL